MKDNEKLFDTLGEIDDKFVEEAASEHTTKKPFIKRYFAIGSAAAAMICVGTAIWASRVPIDTPNHDQVDVPATTQSAETTPPPTEPAATKPAYVRTPYTPNSAYDRTYAAPESSGALSAINADIEFGGMGGGGFGATDPSEITSGNPWTSDWGLTELPVFYSWQHENYRQIGDVTTDVLMDYIRSVADRLGEEFNIVNIDGGDLSPEESAALKEKLEAVGEEFDPGLYRNAATVTAEVGNLTLEVDSSVRGSVKVRIPNAAIAEEFRFHDNLTHAEAVDTANFFCDRFYDLWGCYKPTPAVFSDFTFSGERHTFLYLYDHSDDPLTCLLNYNFCKSSIALYQGYYSWLSLPLEYQDLQSAGMYPIISESQAMDDLLNGKYVTTIWDEYYLPDGMNRDEVTLEGVVYRRTSDQKYTIPYYTFIVELHPESPSFPDGIKEFGEYFVPAIAPEYVASINTDISFN